MNAGCTDWQLSSREKAFFVGDDDGAKSHNDEQKILTSSLDCRGTASVNQHQQLSARH